MESSNLIEELVSLSSIISATLGAISIKIIESIIHRIRKPNLHIELPKKPRLDLRQDNGKCVIWGGIISLQVYNKKKYGLIRSSAAEKCVGKVRFKIKTYKNNKINKSEGKWGDFMYPLHWGINPETSLKEAYEPINIFCDDSAPLDLVIYIGRENKSYLGDRFIDELLTIYAQPFIRNNLIGNPCINSTQEMIKIFPQPFHNRDAFNYYEFHVEVICKDTKADKTLYFLCVSNKTQREAFIYLDDDEQKFIEKVKSKNYFYKFNVNYDIQK